MTGPREKKTMRIDERNVIARKPSSARPLSKAEARRRVANAVAVIISEDGSNGWLAVDLKGNALSEEDAATMRAARDELIAQLERRSMKGQRS